jgi:outer membrane protein TolC
MKTSRSIFRFTTQVSVLAATIMWCTSSFAATNKKVAATTEPETPLLSLKTYLDEVSNKHLGYKSAAQTARAARQYSGEGGTLTAPAFIANATDSSEGRSYPLSPGNHFSYGTYNLGLSQATPIGLSGKVLYNYVDFNIPGLADYYTGYGELDLSLSLYRNFWGGEIKAQQQAIEAGALAKAFSLSYATKATLLEAEANYWRLALARELVTIQKDSVERAQKIADWTERRVRLQLADRSETLQSVSNLQARRLDLRTAEDEARAAALAFNSSRGVLGEVVPEKLTALTPELIQSMAAPERTQKREDVRAAEFQAVATAASANLSREKDKPTVELFGSALLTDPTAPSGALASLVPVTARPVSAIGLRVTAPLNLGTLSTAREGYAAEAQAADWQYQRKVFEEERDWKDLTTKFSETKERYRLYTDLEKTQKEKFEFERERQQRGRSTLLQVLMFESDYEGVQLGRIRTLAELMTLNAQMKLYGVSYESR